MSIIDDILVTPETKNNYNNDISNTNKWQQAQNELRQWCYDNMDSMAMKIKDNCDLFKKYMDVQCKFEKHSVGNILLILKQNPNITHFKDKKSWKEVGVSLVAAPEKFIILEPTKSNGKTYYNPKEEYDITQTNAKRDNKKEYNLRKLLEGIVYNCYAEIKPVDILPDNKLGLSYYDKENNTLYISKGIEPEQLFQLLSYYVADIEMRNLMDTPFKDFKNQCISYMICKKYKVNVPNYNFSTMPIEISSLENGKEVRGELDKIRINFEAINTRMIEGIEKSIKEKNSKKKVQER